jgi:LuxR family maltose regulon positive regulatory protein
LAIWGEVLAELGDLEGALDRATRGVELAESGEDTVVLGWSYLCLMRVLLTAGDLAGAEALVQRVEDYTRKSDIPPWIHQMMAAWQARLWLAQDKLDAASRWMAERRLDIDSEHKFLREFEQLVMVRILVARNELEEAATLLQRLREAAEAGEHTASLIEMLILQALVFQAQSDGDQALHTLETALSRAEPDGFIRTFVDEGPPMGRLLHQAARREMAPAYAQRLLAAFPAASQEPGRSPVAQGPESDLIEPLSEREMEVLQLVSQGLTNREIAARLFLSLNTVKAHTRNIYGKLSVHNRTQAVARARALGALPSV